MFLNKDLNLFWIRVFIVQLSQTKIGDIPSNYQKKDGYYCYLIEFENYINFSWLTISCKEALASPNKILQLSNPKRSFWTPA